MDEVAGWHERPRCESDTVAIVDDFHNWGYTIYRTAYGPLTDQRWQQLLKKLQTQAYAATIRMIAWWNAPRGPFLHDARDR
jgi:hypothetical protein